MNLHINAKMSANKALLNIPQSTEDPFYRYKRPKLVVNTLKQGVQITNIDDIAKALNRNFMELVKYIQLSMKLNVTVKKQGKETKNILLLKNNENIDIDDIIESYIEKYVICKECNNPETIYSLSNKKLYLDCKACGGESELPISDFNKYIKP